MTTKKELNDLQRFWYNKLKQEGFQDCEAYQLYTTKTKHTSYMMGKHTRRPNESTVQVLARIADKGEYLRVIGIYANHALNIPEHIREALIAFADTGNLSQAVKYYEPHRKLLQRYLKRHFPYMLSFVNHLEQE